MLGDERGDRRIHLGFGIGAGFGRHVPRLHDGVGFVVAAATVDRADNRHLIEHRRLFGQVLAELDAGQFRIDRGKGAPVGVGAGRFGIPGIDVAGATGHPEQDHAFASGSDRLLSCRGACSEQTRKAQPRQTGHARLEHSAAIRHEQSFTRTTIQVGERMGGVLGGQTLGRASHGILCRNNSTRA